MADLFDAVPQPGPVPSRSRKLNEIAPIRPDGQFACAVCGAPASFGFGVKLLAGRLGRWACGTHRVEVEQHRPADEPTPAIATEPKELQP